MTLPEHLFDVTSTFTVSHRGVCLEGLRRDQLARVHVGDRVELRTPEGSLVKAEVDAIITHITYVEPRPPVEEERFPILLPLPLTKEDVPIGTEVWLVGHAEDAVLGESQ